MEEKSTKDEKEMRDQFMKTMNTLGTRFYKRAYCSFSVFKEALMLDHSTAIAVRNDNDYMFSPIELVLSQCRQFLGCTGEKVGDIAAIPMQHFAASCPREPMPTINIWPQLLIQSFPNISFESVVIPTMLDAITMIPETTAVSVFAPRKPKEEICIWNLLKYGKKNLKKEHILKGETRKLVPVNLQAPVEDFEAKDFTLSCAFDILFTITVKKEDIESGKYTRFLEYLQFLSIDVIDSGDMRGYRMSLIATRSHKLIQWQRSVCFLVKV